MKSLAVCLLLGVSTTLGIKHSSFMSSKLIQRKRAEVMDTSQTCQASIIPFLKQDINFTCTYSIDRLNANAHANDWQSIVAAGQPFTDDTFPFGTAIAWYNHCTGGALETTIPYMTWNRTTAMIKDATLWPTTGGIDNISYDDINQGQLNDCYFLSSCAVVAPRTTAMHSIFQTPAFNAAGLFALKAYVRGKPYTVVIDDYLPFKSGNLFFDYVGSDHSTWGPYLEKAWAHVMGNYEMTEWGLHTEAL